ncbi:MAG: MarR family transcriptional regulator [Bdellovibrionales bacterium]|nr:MarR family transcriptional regulator [Bdellovibrionales bacterium]
MTARKYAKKEKLESLLNTRTIISWRLALNTVEEVYSRLEDELVKHGCNMSRFEMLFLIYFSGPLSAIQLSQKMKVSRGNISSFIKRLLNDDLIAPCKITSTATRPKYSLSKGGEDFFEKILKIHLKHINKILTPLSETTLKDISKWRDAL